MTKIFRNILFLLRWDELHNIRHFTVQKGTELVNGVCGNAFAIFHGIIGASGKAHFFQTVGGNLLPFQRFKKGFIADQFPHLPHLNPV